MENHIYYMKELLPSVRRMVKKRKPGIFRSTFIIHRKKAYGYAENGASFLLNAVDVRRCARYRWTIRNGYVVSFDIIPGSCVRLDSFLTEVHSP